MTTLSWWAMGKSLWLLRLYRWNRLGCIRYDRSPVTVFIAVSDYRNNCKLRICHWQCIILARPGLSSCNLKELEGRKEGRKDSEASSGTIVFLHWHESAPLSHSALMTLRMLRALDRVWGAIDINPYKLCIDCIAHFKRDFFDLTIQLSIGIKFSQSV